MEKFPTWRKLGDNLAAGGNPLRDALATTRRMGNRFVTGFRMNDSHYVYLEDLPTHNNFWRAHPSIASVRATAKNSISDSTAVFNYLRPEVRDSYFAMLEEICTKYDVDGVELDFQPGAAIILRPGDRCAIAGIPNLVPDKPPRATQATAARP